MASHARWRRRRAGSTAERLVARQPPNIESCSLAARTRRDAWHRQKAALRGESSPWQPYHNPDPDDIASWVVHHHSDCRDRHALSVSRIREALGYRQRLEDRTRGLVTPSRADRTVGSTSSTSGPFRPRCTRSSRCCRAGYRNCTDTRCVVGLGSSWTDHTHERSGKSLRSHSRCNRSWLVPSRSDLLGLAAPGWAWSMPWCPSASLST